MDVQEYYDDFSVRYEEKRGRGYHALIDDLEADLVSEYLGSSGRVLEVGCGTGLILGRLRSPGREVYGVDLSREMLSRARSRSLSVAHADALSLPFADESFDVVCSFKVLSHVPPIEAALEELARVLRPGGVLLAEFYNPLSLRYLVKRVVGARQTGVHVAESDVTTRWDTPWRISTYLPREVELVELRGVRIVTPFAGALSIPILGRLLRGSERRLTAVPRAAVFGGFVVAVASKK